MWVERDGSVDGVRARGRVKVRCGGCDSSWVAECGCKVCLCLAVGQAIRVREHREGVFI